MTGTHARWVDVLGAALEGVFLALNVPLNAFESLVMDSEAILHLILDSAIETHSSWPT